MSKLTNPSLLLLRNEDELIGKSILVVNFEQDGFLHELKTLNPDSVITAFSYNHANFMYASKIAGVHAVVDHTIPHGNYDLVIYYYPKAKPEAQMCLDNIRAVCHQDVQLFVVGENKSGVKSAEKQLKDHCNFSNKIDSAKHCILYLFSELTLNDSFDISRYHKQFQVKAGEVEFTAISVPGVFNHGALDVGTAVLLNNAPSISKGKVLDFACGAGIIATYLGLKQPELEFVCSDVSALATYATEQTLALNHLKGQTVLSDGLANINGKFDLIISNPPFHTGIATDYTIAEAFLSSAKQHLSKQGQLTIVANSFLKYPPILEAQFGQYSTDYKNTKFAVYSAK